MALFFAFPEKNQPFVYLRSADLPIVQGIRTTFGLKVEIGMHFGKVGYGNMASSRGALEGLGLNFRVMSTIDDSHLAQ